MSQIWSVSVDSESLWHIFGISLINVRLLRSSLLSFFSRSILRSESLMPKYIILLDMWFYFLKQLKISLLCYIPITSMTTLFKNVPSHNNGASTDAQILLWLLLSHNLCRCCFWKWHVSSFSTYLCIRAVPYTQLGVEKWKNENNHSRMVLLSKQRKCPTICCQFLFNERVIIYVYMGNTVTKLR